jgi:hypothetical protein
MLAKNVGGFRPIADQLPCGLGLNGLRPASALATSALSAQLSKTKRFRHRRPRRRVIGRDHRIIRWKLPFGRYCSGVKPCAARRRFSDLNRLPSSRQIKYSGEIDLRMDTAGSFDSSFGAVTSATPESLAKVS